MSSSWFAQIGNSQCACALCSPSMAIAKFLDLLDEQEDVQEVWHNAAEGDAEEEE